MRNFDYIKDCRELSDLYRFCAAAEEHQLTTPDYSAISARKALEYIVRSIYTMKGIEVDDRDSLFELSTGYPFTDFINDDRIMASVHYVRKMGNNAAHGKSVTKTNSFFALMDLYNIVGAVLMKLRFVDEVVPFDKTLVPNYVAQPTVVPPTVVVKPNDPIVTVVKPEAVHSPEPVVEVKCDISEAETRKRFIDLMLEEAGWEVLDQKGLVQAGKACIEVKVTGMPNDEGVGYVDYVLYGTNGKPLAVVEAKRATVSPIKGKEQAILYADCLEKQHGVRPVIYYTNGWETYIIDGMGYPARRLYSFHTAADLELMIQKRARKDISDFTVKDSITDRYYQKMAIKAVCEHYNKKHRRALLVMATGTGKTRVSISLVDVLARNGWVKNVLFLADRTSLVSQAHKNFVKLMPNMTTCILNEKGNQDLGARIIFSTYQTMINYIDTEDKQFSVGRFDLIIIDEAHRSIFGKYGAIFSYFDSLLVGLTATPRDQVDKSTYDVFEMEQGSPNYAYELTDAVADGYLVKFTGIKCGTMILKDGIKYSALTPAEREQLEKIWEYEQSKQMLDVDTRDPHRDISPKELFSYIFNEDTIDKVLQKLMTDGIKVQSGERLGKTIIFAYNHRHAELIVERFNKLYPECGPDYCVLIDNYVTYAQSLIDKFEIRDGDPQIAVSVDMLDTGIDVPDIVNLVFFKIVKSRIKFDQMIGRGTRLSQGLFGPGKDKKEFYIFDWCRNFEYFEQNPEGTMAKQAPSLTERIFALNADIAFHLQHAQYQEDDYCKQLCLDIKQEMREQVKTLNESHISVREHWDKVSHFMDNETWVCLSDLDVIDLKDPMARLLPKSKVDESAKALDVFLLTIELAHISEEHSAGKCVERVVNIASKLQEKAVIPQVQAKMPVIKEVLSPASWENVSLPWLEKVRKELREIVKFLTGEQDKRFIVDIEDVVLPTEMAQGIAMRVSYKQRIIDFLAENRDLPVLQKIYNIEPLQLADIKELERILWHELGSREDYDKQTAGMQFAHNVAAFIRAVMGIDRKEAVKKFNDFISGAPLNADQEEFLMTVLQYVCENGDITKDIIVNEAPFDERLPVFTAYLLPLAKYVDSIHSAITPAVGYGDFTAPSQMAAES